ncbi:hypothetical protein CAP31_01075 [Sulfuriferula sp. AH1]|nr:hypothetical protein CAP31_01075 [Sulfuriferula sp. AH1]
MALGTYPMSLTRLIQRLYGIEKLDQMCVQFDAAEIARFHAGQGGIRPSGLTESGQGQPDIPV